MNTLMHLQLMLGAGPTNPGGSSQSGSAAEGSPFQVILGQREAEQTTVQNFQNPQKQQDLTGQQTMENMQSLNRVLENADKDALSGTLRETLDALLLQLNDQQSDEKASKLIAQLAAEMDAAGSEVELVSDLPLLSSLQQQMAWQVGFGLQPGVSPGSQPDTPLEDGLIAGLPGQLFPSEFHPNGVAKRDTQHSSLRTSDVLPQAVAQTSMNGEFNAASQATRLTGKGTTADGIPLTSTSQQSLNAALAGETAWLKEGLTVGKGTAVQNPPVSLPSAEHTLGQTTLLTASQAASQANALASSFEHSLANALVNAQGGPQVGAQTGSPVNPQMTAQGMLHANLGTPQWGAELGQQMATMMQRGNQQVSLHLNPQELGPLTVDIRVHEQQAQLQLMSSHAQVRAAVEQALPQLREALAEQGISLGETSVGEQQSQSRQEEDRHRAAVAGNPEDIQPVASDADIDSIATVIDSGSGINLYV